METPEELRQSAKATVRYETRPGKQLQTDFWGGIPEQVLVDNAKALITLNNPRTGALVVNPTFAALPAIGVSRSRPAGRTGHWPWGRTQQPRSYRGVAATPCEGRWPPAANAPQSLH